jgi:SAM-dependent methyltransferase
VFLDSEGDRYFQRNEKKLRDMHAMALQDTASDPIVGELAKLRPESILMVGAGNGWRLDVAYRLWGATGIGVEPSAVAVRDGQERFPHLTLHVGTAAQLPEVRVRCVVFSGCLCLCDRGDLFRIASEADGALESGGYLVIFDFYPPVPYRNPYAHHPGMFVNKMDHASLWTWHPAYVLWSQKMLLQPGVLDPVDPNQRMATTVLRKFSH